MSEDPAAQVQSAEQREAEARARLTGTLHDLQEKLNPKTLARDAARKAVDRGQDAARSGAEVARANPAPIAGAVALFGLFLARHRIARLFRRKPKKVPAAPISHSDPAPPHFSEDRP